MIEHRLKGWREVIDLDFPPIEVAEATRQTMVEYARAHNVVDARLAMGRIYTDAEYEARRKKVLSTPLP